MQAWLSARFGLLCRNEILQGPVSRLEYAGADAVIEFVSEHLVFARGVDLFNGGVKCQAQHGLSWNRVHGSFRCPMREAGLVGMVESARRTRNEAPDARRKGRSPLKRIISSRVHAGD